MLNTLLSLPLPIFDQVFDAWGIPTAFSKLVVFFSLVTAILISRLSVSSGIVVIPTAFLFLVGCAMFTYWVLADISMVGPDPFRKVLASLIVGQSIGGLLMMAFFKTGNKHLAGV
jgi:hypothetical protein